jgi:hypothetical protein
MGGLGRGGRTAAQGWMAGLMAGSMKGVCLAILNSGVAARCWTRGVAGRACRRGAAWCRCGC